MFWSLDQDVSFYELTSSTRAVHIAQQLRDHLPCLSTYEVHWSHPSIAVLILEWKQPNVTTVLHTMLLDNISITEYNYFNDIVLQKL
jgi:hypothetical protein